MDGFYNLLRVHEGQADSEHVMLVWSAVLIRLVKGGGGAVFLKEELTLIHPYSRSKSD